MRITILVAAALSILAWAGSSWAWDPDEVEELEPKVAAARAELLENDPGVQSFFDKASGYVIFPTVGKGGFGIGGARGTGLLKVGGQTAAVVTLTELTFGAQASAVAITAGASADAEFNSGIAIFTQAKGGLMYEASVGGQKFKVEVK